MLTEKRVSWNKAPFKELSDCGPIIEDHDHSFGPAVARGTWHRSTMFDDHRSRPGSSYLCTMSNINAIDGNRSLGVEEQKARSSITSTPS